VFSTFLECSQLFGVSLSQCNTRLTLLLLLYDITFADANNKTRFFYVRYSDKAWVFDQSECMQGPIYIINVLIIHQRFWY